MSPSSDVELPTSTTAGHRPRRGEHRRVLTLEAVEVVLGHTSTPRTVEAIAAVAIRIEREPVTTAIGHSPGVERARAHRLFSHEHARGDFTPAV